jgi:hypothetical protein
VRGVALARLPRSASGRKRMKYSVNRQWVMTLEHVRDTFARDDIDPVLRVFRGTSAPA